MEITKTNLPKNGTAADSKPTEQKPVTTPVVVTQKEEQNPLRILPTKTATAIFDRLEEGIKMKEQYTKFKEKVDEFDSFVRDYDDEGLSMKIENIGTGNAVQLQSVPMILDFIKNVVVKAGRKHLKDMEDEIVQFVL
jgi:hypothetical protein